MRIFFYLLIIFSGFSSTVLAQCCTIIDVTKEAGTFTIRDGNTGRIQVFKPDALEGAELKVGDSIHALFDTMKVVSVKGVARKYDLTDPVYGDSCCTIFRLDSIPGDSLMKVTAKNKTTGESIYFNVPGMLAAKLDSGEIVFTKPSHGYAMIAPMQKDSSRKLLLGFPLLQETTGK